MVRRIGLLGAVLGLLMLDLAGLSLGIWQEQLSVDDTDWNGLSDLRGSWEAAGYRTTRSGGGPMALRYLDDPRGTVYAVIGAERPRTTDESRVLWDYILAGGSLLLADDFGYGNTLLSETSIQGRFPDAPAAPDRPDQRRIADPRFEKNPRLITGHVESPPMDVLLNEPTYLDAYPQTARGGFRGAWTPQLLFESSDLSWKDLNGNFRRDPGEQYPFGAPYAVYYAGDPGDLLRRGTGRAVLVADPSMFTNDMLRRADNREFALHVLALLSPAPAEILIDEGSHLRRSAFDNAGATFAYVAYAVTGVPALAIPVASLVLLLGMLALAPSRNPGPFPRHRDRLSERRLHLLAVPDLHWGDYLWVRDTFLEKVRLRFGLTYEEFSLVTTEQLKWFVADGPLVEFVCTPTVDSFVGLNAMVQRMDQWPELPTVNFAERLRMWGRYYVPAGDGIPDVMPIEVAVTYVEPAAPVRSPAPEARPDAPPEASLPAARERMPESVEEWRRYLEGR